MMLPIINVQAMNVELTDEQSKLITRKLAPLARLAPDSEVRFDVVIRTMKRTWMGTRFCVSVRLNTGIEKYYAVARDPYLAKALSSLRHDLRRSVSKAYRVEEEQQRPRRRYLTERQYVELFA